MRRILEKFLGADKKEQKIIPPAKAFGEHVDTALRIQNLKRERRLFMMGGKGDTEEARRMSDEIEKLEQRKSELRDIVLPRKVS